MTLSHRTHIHQWHVFSLPGGLFVWRYIILYWFLSTSRSHSIVNSMLTFLLALEFAAFHHSTWAAIITVLIIGLILVVMMLILIVGSKIAMDFDPSSWLQALRGTLPAIVKFRQTSEDSDDEKRGRPRKRLSRFLRGKRGRSADTLPR